MDSRRLLTLFAVLIVSLFAVPAVASAKTVEFRGVVSGSPYGASNGYMAVPVLYSKQTLRNFKLKSPVGLLMVKRTLSVKLPNGAPRILPVNMRTGDRFKGKLAMKSIYQRTFYPRVTFKQVTVYFRSKELSTAELNAAIIKIRQDLDRLTDFVGKLTNYTTANFAALRADIADLRAQLDSLRNMLNGLSGQLQALTAQLDAITKLLQSQIDSLTNDVNNIKTQLQGLLTRVTSLEAGLGGLTTQVTNLSTTLNSLTSALGPVTGLTGNLVSKLTTVESTITQLQGLLTGISTGDLSGLLTKVTGLQTDVTGLLFDMNDPVNGALARLDGIDTQIGAIGPIVTSLKTTVLDPGGLSETVGGLLTDVSSLEATSATVSDITNLQGQIDLVNGTLGPLNTLVNTSIKPTVDQLGLDVGGLQTKVGSICTSLTSTVDGLNSLIGVVDLLPGTTVPGTVTPPTC